MARLPDWTSKATLQSNDILPIYDTNGGLDKKITSVTLANFVLKDSGVNISIANNAPEILLYDTNGTVDERKYKQLVSSDKLSFLALNDAETISNEVFFYKSDNITFLENVVFSTVDGEINFSELNVDLIGNQTTGRFLLTAGTSTDGANIIMRGSSATSPNEMLFRKGSVEYGSFQNSGNFLIKDTVDNTIDLVQAGVSTDVSLAIGYARNFSIGGLAYWSHIDNSTVNNAALFQSSAGGVVLNKKVGQNLSFRTGGSTTLALFTETAFESAVDILLDKVNPNIYLKTLNNDRLVISGGDSTGTGANIILRGGVAASVASMEFRQNTAERARFAPVTGNFLIRTTDDSFGVPLRVGGGARIDDNLSLGGNFTLGGEINPTTNPTESNTTTLSVNGSTEVIPRGTYNIKLVTTGSISSTNFITLILERFIDGGWQTLYTRGTNTSGTLSGASEGLHTSTGASTGAGALRIRFTTTGTGTGTGKAVLQKT